MGFNIGDKVRRVSGAHLDMTVGDTGCVTAIRNSSIALAEYCSTDIPPGWHDGSKFVLVEPAVGESDPSGISAHTPGAKLDAGKLRPALVLGGFAAALEAVVKVGTDGAAKYTDNGWKEVPNGLARYDDAARRHTTKRDKGELHDADSGSLHLAHEAWNALARLELFLKDNQ